MQRTNLTMDFLLVVKTVIATTGAWWICVHLLDSQMPFLAPWVAFFALQPTVNSSLTSGLQTVVASGIGVLLSSAVSAFLGVNVWSYALAIFLGLLGSRIPGLRKEGAAIATTAVFLLSTGFTEDTPTLIDRMVEISIGVAIGVGINLIVIPPLRDQEAVSAVEALRKRMGEVMESIAEGFSESWDSDRARECSDDVRQMRRDLDESWATVQFARNSRQRNPRLLIQGGPGWNYEQVLTALDEATAHLRNLIRTLEDTSESESVWDQRFREKWSGILKTTAQLLRNPNADVDSTVDQLDRLAYDMLADEQLSAENWPLYGSLITSLRNISVLMQDVSTATSES